MRGTINQILFSWVVWKGDSGRQINVICGLDEKMTGLGTLWILGNFIWSMYYIVMFNANFNE